MSLPKWSREPLLHFMLLGFGLFLIDGWMAGSNRGTGENIVVTGGRVQQLAAAFEGLNQRAPTRAELDVLVEDAIREEILVREAIALGLDQDDTIVRRRLRQKLEFLSEDLTAVPEPSEPQLLAYLQANAGKYRAETRYSLVQVYLDPQKHGAALADDAATLLADLRRDAEHRHVDGAGDAFLLPRRYEQVGAAELSRLFGADFESALQTMPEGTWSGPVPSGYGVHLVWLEDRHGGGTVALADIRDAVRRDWVHEQRKQANERFYDELRKQYDVEVERPVAAARKSGPSLASELAR